MSSPGEGPFEVLARTPFRRRVRLLIVIPLLVLALLVLLLQGAMAIYYSKVTVPATAEARPVMASLMTTGDVPSGWTLSEASRARATSNVSKLGRAEEAYIVNDFGYPWPEHRGFHGLSRRKGKWYSEEGQFNVPKRSAYTYGFREIDQETAQRTLARIDRAAQRLNKTRADLNLVDPD